MGSLKENTIYVCATCERPEGGSAREDCERLRAALKDAELELRFEVIATPCLGGCVAPVNIALKGRERGSYVFDDLDIAEFEKEIMTLCRMYLVLKNGWIVDARPLGELRKRLRARIPTF